MKKIAVEIVRIFYTGTYALMSISDHGALAVLTETVPMANRPNNHGRSTTGGKV